MILTAKNDDKNDKILKVKYAIFCDKHNINYLSRYLISLMIRYKINQKYLGYNKNKKNKKSF